MANPTLVNDQVERVLAFANEKQREAQAHLRQASDHAKYYEGFAQGVLTAIAAAQGVLPDDPDPEGNLVKFPGVS